jgi:hypothetical protein
MLWIDRVGSFFCFLPLLAIVYYLIGDMTFGHKHGGIVTAPVDNAKFVPTFQNDVTENCVSQSAKRVCCHFWIVLRMVVCSKVDQ